MSRETVLRAFLIERGIEHFQQKYYVEEMTLFPLVGTCILCQQMHLADSLAALNTEYTKRSEFQRRPQNLKEQFIEVQDEPTACDNIADVLQSMLLHDLQDEHSGHAFRYVHHELRHTPIEDVTANSALYAVCLPF